eukprot:gene7259-371_t
MFSVTIVVVAVPEGLPLAVTISLAYSMMKMMRDKSFVRVLAACETMGGATAICSDKTGTLTENRMTVVEGWFGGKKLGHAPAAHELSPNLLSDLMHNIALSSKAFLIEDDDGRIEFVGNRTECALLVLMRSWGVDYQELREDCTDKVAKWEVEYQELREDCDDMVAKGIYIIVKWGVEYQELREECDDMVTKVG